MRFGGILSRLGKGTRSFISTRHDRTQLQMESLEERVVLNGTTDDVFGCDEITDQFGNKMAVLSVLPKPVGSTEHGGPCGCSACAAMLAEMAATASASGATWTSAGAWSSFDASQVFRLHSNPGANHTIYLDFDGHVTTGTPWNNTYGSSIVTEAYDIDGNPSTFSLTELQNIYNIWRRVAEDFAPFNVNVTTQEPNIEMLRRTGSGDTQWGVRVVIGGNGSWFGSAGGVAYINSFSWSSDTPAFVFSRNLSSEKSVAEAITHEVGHTLGLRHHGTSSSAYYNGHGSGETGWAPIMGVGYHRNLTQWSRGDYPGANNSGQDDLAIITNSTNGFGYRADDVGNTISTASPLTVTGNTVFASGIIERNTDVDVFYFDTGAGTITINANPAPIGPNLDIQLELLDANGNVIAISNPPDQLSASLTLTLSAGRYYVRIQGVGKDTFSTGGYSDYGSLGQYSISGTIVSPTSPPVSPPPVSPPPSVSPPPVSPPPVVVSPPPVSPPVSPPPVSPPPVSPPVSPPPVSPPPVSPPPVSPPVVVVDDGDVGFTSGGGWVAQPNSRGLPYFGGDHYYRWGSPGGAASQWSASLSAGTYRVSVTWVADPNRATDARYSIVDGAGNVLVTRTINQQLAPDDFISGGAVWEDLGTVTLSSAGTLVVRLSGEGNGYLIADAVRFEMVNNSVSPPPVSPPSVSPPVSPPPVSPPPVSPPPVSPPVVVSPPVSPPPVSPPPVSPPVSPPPVSPPPVSPPPVSPPVVVVDDGDVGFTSGGGWVAQPNSRGLPYFGGDHYYRWGSPGGAASQWSASLSAGTYRVSVTWVADPNRATDARYSIVDGAGNVLVTRTINQQLAPDDFISGGAVWEDLGTVTLSSAGTLVVRLSGEGNGYLIADAVRFEMVNNSVSPPPVSPPSVSPPVSPPPVSPPPVSPPPVSPPVVVSPPVSPPPVSPPPVSPPPVSPPVVVSPPVSPPPVSPPPVSPPPVSPPVVVVDDGDVGFTSGGGWVAQPNSRGLPYFGGDHYYRWGSPGGAASQWSASLSAGTYRVSVTWVADPNRATDARYSIVDGAGNVLVTRTINQQLAPDDFISGGAVWEDLGTVTLSSAGTLVVRLSGEGNGYLIADAVRFERIGPATAVTALPVIPDAQPSIVHSSAQDPGTTDNTTWLPGRDTPAVKQTVDRLTNSLAQFREKLRFLTEDNDSGWRDALVHLRSRLSLKL